MPPREVTVFVDEDGSVTFSDLTAELAEVARALDPDASPACAVAPPRPPRPRRKERTP